MYDAAGYFILLNPIYYKATLRIFLFFSFLCSFFRKMSKRGLAHITMTPGLGYCH